MRPKASNSKVAGISETFLSNSFSKVLVKRLKVLGSTPQTLGCDAQYLAWLR